jgi:hypothetical protein
MDFEDEVHGVSEAAMRLDSYHPPAAVRKTARWHPPVTWARRLKRVFSTDIENGNRSMSNLTSHPNCSYHRTRDYSTVATVIRREADV